MESPTAIIDAVTPAGRPATSIETGAGAADADPEREHPASVAAEHATVAMHVKRRCDID